MYTSIYYIKYIYTGKIDCISIGTCCIVDTLFTTIDIQTNNTINSLV